MKKFQKDLRSHRHSTKNVVDFNQVALGQTHDDAPEVGTADVTLATWRMNEYYWPDGSFKGEIIAEIGDGVIVHWVRNAGTLQGV